MGLYFHEQSGEIKRTVPGRYEDRRVRESDEWRAITEDELEAIRADGGRRVELANQPGETFADRGQERSIAGQDAIAGQTAGGGTGAAADMPAGAAVGDSMPGEAADAGADTAAVDEPTPVAVDPVAAGDAPAVDEPTPARSKRR